MLKRSLFPSVVVLGLLAGACNNSPSSNDGGGGAGTGGGGGGGGAPKDEMSWDTAPYTLEPGQERTYMCYTFRLPADKETIVREIEPIYGKATHHLGIYYTFQQDEPEGEFECPELTRDNWIPLYGGGAESGTLTLPEGAGFHLKAGQQILVQLHLLNAASEPVTDKAKIVFRTLDNPDAVQAGMFGFDNRAVVVPAQTQGHEESMTCSPIGRDMDVFAVFGHMHQHGKHIEVSRGAVPGEEVLYEADWKFEEQPTEPKLFHVSKDDSIHVRCWYDNNTAVELPYGESTYNEMCSFVFYYTPYKSLFGCLKTPTP